MQARMSNPAMIVPGAMRALVTLSATSHGSVPSRTLDLVYLRASQINGCSVCVEMHARDLRKAGETDERLFAVGAWRESPYFTDAERAALALTEAATRISDRVDPAPTAVAPRSLIGNLQGWFVLHGLVEMPHPCRGGSCLSYGYAFGACSRKQAGSIDGIVPWVGGHRARLLLVPGSQAAILTVEVDDGSPPQTATAPATLGEQPSGQTLAADFELPAGRLSLWVEWLCGGSG